MSSRQARLAFEKVSAWCLLAKQLGEAQEEIYSAERTLRDVERESFPTAAQRRKAVHVAATEVKAATKRLAKLRKAWDARGE